MKQAVLAVVCVILIFIATLLAIASYVMSQNAAIRKSSAASIKTR